MYLLFVAYMSTNLLQHLLYVALMVLLPYYLNYLLYASLHIQNHKMAISYISHFTFISSFITSENIHIVAYSTSNNRLSYFDKGTNLLHWISIWLYRIHPKYLVKYLYTYYKYIPNTRTIIYELLVKLIR